MSESEIIISYGSLDKAANVKCRDANDYVLRIPVCGSVALTYGTGHSPDELIHSHFSSVT